MERKNVIISIVALFVISAWVYFTIANDDATCYTYTSSVSACSSNQTSCTPWENWTRFCDWTNVTTYTRWAIYRCAYSNDKWASYSDKWVCRVQYTDTQTPKVTNGWIE